MFFFSSSKNRSEKLPFFLVHFCCFFRFDVWAKEWFIYLFQLVLTTWCALHAIYSNLKPKYMRIHESIVTSLTLFSSAKFVLMCNLFFFPLLRCCCCNNSKDSSNFTRKPYNVSTFQCFCYFYYGSLI